MDFETLFALALILIWVFSQLFTGKKRTGKRPTPQPTPDSSPLEEQAQTYEDNLEDALREIRKALGGRPEPEPAAESVETAQVESEPPSTVEPGSLPPPRKFQPPPTSYAEEAFEDLPAYGERFETALDTKETRLSARGPSDAEPTERLPALQEVPEVEVLTRSKRRSSREMLLRRLHDPGSVREAVVLSEILGPPRARRS